ncbi:MAG TPA: RDD family protein [Armatimonadota bacterium]|jgi:uncharacterized RDD family membrane protein YckC
MPLSFNCPVCDHHLDAPDAAAGRSGDCKFCHARIVAPAEPGQPATLESAGLQPSRLDPPERNQPVDAVSTAAPPLPMIDTLYPPGGEPYVPTAKPDQRIPRAMMYGDLARRLLAFVVDNIILGITTDLFLMSVVAPIIGRPAFAVVQTRRIVWPTFLFIEWFYYTAMESSQFQATLGKMLFGLKVADTWGEQMTFGRAGARSAAKWLSQWTFMIGYLMAMFNNKSQTLHDVIAGTVVIES